MATGLEIYSEISMTDTNYFMKKLVDIGNQISGLSTQILSFTYPGHGKQIKYAICGGMLVRITKLHHTILQMACDKKGEIIPILQRPLIETYLSLAYLLKKDDDKVYKKFIERNAIDDKRQKHAILQKVSGRKQIPIEKRMLKSIAHHAAKDDVDFTKIPDKPSGTSWIPGVEYKDMAKEIEWPDLYTFFYAVATRFSHPSWHDLKTNHLSLCKNHDRDKEHYVLDNRYTSPKPQLLEASFVVTLKALSIFNLHFCDNNEDFNKTITRIENEIFQEIDEHEKYLQSQ